MLKHLRIAKNCPFQVSWQAKFKCRYVCLVSLSVRFLSIVITRLCWYPKLPLLYYFVFPIVTQKICCLETIPSCVNSTSLSFKLFLKFTKMGQLSDHCGHNHKCSVEQLVGNHFQQMPLFCWQVWLFSEHLVVFACVLKMP